MEIQNLEYAIKVAECGSITSASQQLYISQPNLTQIIQKLEKSYGIKIFDRTPTGVRLTPEGKEFIYYAKNVVANYKTLKELFTQPKVSHAKVLSVAVMHLDFVDRYLAKTYKDCCDETFHFNAVSCDRNGVVRLVQEGRVDLGILVTSSSGKRKKVGCGLEDNRNLEVHPIANSGVYVVCGPKSRLYDHEEGTKIPVQDITDMPMIVLDLEENVVQAICFKNNTHGFNGSKQILTNSITTCIELLSKTDVCLYTHQWVLESFKSKKLRAFQVDYGENTGYRNQLCWIKRVSDQLNETEQYFIRQVISDCAEIGMLF